MKYAICNEMFGKWPWERVCDFVASLGYTGLEVAPFTLADNVESISAQSRRDLRRAAGRIEILGLHWLLVKPEGLHMTHPDDAVRRRTADYFRSLIRFCADLGGRVMVIGSPKQRNLLAGVTREQAMANAAELFASVLDLAAERAVTLAFEPLGPKETGFINTAAEAVELIRRIDHPNFKLNLDGKAMSSEGKPIPDIIRASGPYIAHVQVNDPSLLGPGMGELDYKPIIAALRQVGYDGWLSVEAFDFRLGAENIARESIRYLREVAS
jgi:sugar phosphate isomerase/epimerase